MLTNILKPAMDNAIQRFDTKNEMMSSAMLALGVTQRNVQWSGETSMWSTVAQSLMTFFKGFIYAITSFVAILCYLGMFGVNLIGKYMMTLFWINLWLPIMSICNLYLIIATSGKLHASTSGLIDTFFALGQNQTMLTNQIAEGGMLLGRHSDADLNDSQRIYLCVYYSYKQTERRRPS